ncbi:MAG: hypothetical protein ACYTGW_07835 [Planctomycetota bacterium]|jgi:hypothetical protein
MAKILIPAALAATLVASSISAQSFYMPSNTPTMGAACNVIPFGTTNTSATWVNQKYQCMATNAELGKLAVANICEIAFSPCGTGTGNYHFDSIEIVLAQTNATSLSTTFATNVATNAQTVLKATNYDWHVTGSSWNRIGFDRPYLYISGRGANLVIQLTLMGSHKTGSGISTGFFRDATHQRVYATNWTGSPPASGASGNAALKFEVSANMNDLHTFGVGCQGANGVPTLTLTGSAQLGQSFAFNLANAPVSAPVYHVLGLKRTEPRFDLGAAGAPGCFLYESIDSLSTVVSNASGVYSSTVSVPQDRALLCLRVYTQFFPFDRSNAFGLTASNYGRILLGN